MLKSFITFFTSIFERDYDAETVPSNVRHQPCLVSTTVFGMTIAGGVYAPGAEVCLAATD